MRFCVALLASVEIVALSSPAFAGSETFVDPRSGSTLKVKQGDDLVLKLHATAGTGYQWKVVSTDRSLGYPKLKVEDLSPGRVGGGLYYVFIWKTRVPYPLLGSHAVKLAYLRSWEPDRPAKTLNLKIRVVQ
jgi:predicted secreted protein